MIGAVLAIVAIIGACVVSAYAGIAIYAHRDRLSTAFSIARGHIALEKIENGQKFKCVREHPEAGYVVIKKIEYDRLVRAANELTVARGFIGDVEAIRGKTTYSEVVTETLSDGAASQ